MVGVNMEKSYSSGDIVILKSGGLPMTVLKINQNSADPEVLVAYFDLDGNVIRDGFPPESLELSETRWDISFCVDIDEDKNEWE